jgi:ribosomal-protein-alanine N-acetyltransferase
MDLKHYYQGLNSNRLLLRKLTFDDVTSWVHFYENNPNLPYLEVDLNRTNIAMSRAWIEAQINRYDKNEFGQLGIILKETGKLIGTIGFLIDERCGLGELIKATAIIPKFWGQKIGKEASVLIINANFKYNWSQKIIGFRHENNFSSQRLKHSLGFQDVLTIDEKHRRTIKYELTKTKWHEHISK